MMKYISITALVFCSPLSATQLVYTPTNPTFGGSPYNSSFLLSKAQSQISSDDSTLSFEEQFRSALNRNLISSLASQIVDGQLTEGSYNTGDYQIDIAGTNDTGVTITITNLGTDEVTIITMPSLGGN